MEIEDSPASPANNLSTPLMRLESRYPDLYSTLVAQDSQKHMMRACDELEMKECHEKCVEDARQELLAANDAVYLALAAVDEARKKRDDAVQEERQATYRYLPY